MLRQEQGRGDWTGGEVVKQSNGMGAQGDVGNPVSLCLSVDFFFGLKCLYQCLVSLTSELSGHPSERTGRMIGR